MLDDEAILLQLLTDKEMEEVLLCAKDKARSPFVVLDRWLEVIASPPSPRWVKVSGVPLHAWREGVFSLIGDCLGQTLAVDQDTISKEILTHGRVKVLLGKVRKLSVAHFHARRRPATLRSRGGLEQPPGDAL